VSGTGLSGSSYGFAAAEVRKYPALGYHFYQQLEKIASATNYTVNDLTESQGLLGHIWG
jgi:hypothetical protein